MVSEVGKGYQLCWQVCQSRSNGLQGPLWKVPLQILVFLGTVYLDQKGMRTQLQQQQQQQQGIPNYNWGNFKLSCPENRLSAAAAHSPNSPVCLQLHFFASKPVYQEFLWRF